MNKDARDKKLQRIIDCTDFNELISLMHSSIDPHRPSHIVQGIKTFNEIEDKPKDVEEITKILFEGLNSVKEQLSFHDLSNGIFYLIKYLKDPREIRSLVDYSLQKLQTSEEVDLSSLARLTVVLNILRDIPVFHTYPIIIPRLQRHLEAQELTVDDLVYLTSTMKHFIRSLSTEMMDKYITRVEEFLSRGSFDSPSASTNLLIMKICNFLNSSRNIKSTKLTRDLMQRLDVSLLDSPGDISVTFKIVQSQLEPRKLMSSLLERSSELREKGTSPDPLLLQCDVLRALPEARRELVAQVEGYLRRKKELLSTEDVLLIFKILRKAKVNQSKLCNIYWNKVLEKVKAEKEEREADRLIHHCHRYMYFNNNLGGTYRYFALERFLLDLIMTELREGVSRFEPQKLSRLSGFLIAYGDSEDVPQMILDKLLKCQSQLDYSDCLQLSRGIQIALELRFRNGIPLRFSRQISALEKVMDEAILERLSVSKDLSIIDANIIVRGLTMRKNNEAVKKFEMVFRRFEIVDFPVTSRIIRDTTMNLSQCRYKAPQLLEAFLGYIEQQRETISGDTVEKIFNACFSLGHETANFEALKCGAEIVERDFEFMSGLAVVNSCLALCYYGELSQKLMAKVFCIDFIRRLEEEIKLCYSKATYPQKVLNKVMQLNRSVCLDHPEYNVPWFQQNYVEAQTTKSSPNEIFQKDVLRRFKAVFGDAVERIELNHSTAYGYRLDFLLKIDDFGKLIPKESESCSRKLAIILLSPTSFCHNDPSNMCGYDQLRRRHLEILGFEVMEISYNSWQLSNVDQLRQQFIERNIVVQ